MTLALHPTDPRVVKFIQRHEELLGDMQTAELMHMAGSFGRPGSLTEGGQRYSKLAANEQAHKLWGLLYALKMGYISLDEITLVD